jgi:hypothetical protein
MKEQIEKAVQESELKSWAALETKFKGKVKGNFKRTMFNLIDKLNIWLKEIDLQLTVKQIEDENKDREI